jgi:mannose-6-phosphate isomerase-like protein (cupin superfamily)
MPTVNDHPPAPGFATLHLRDAKVEKAPDGSEAQPLLRLGGGSMARFRLPPGRCSRAVKHRRVEELWLFTAGQGELWRQDDSGEEITRVEPGTCISLPRGTCFQFRCLGQTTLEAVGVTMPPWPGDGEAEAVTGPWSADL